MPSRKGCPNKNGYKWTEEGRAKRMANPPAKRFDSKAVTFKISESVMVRLRAEVPRMKARQFVDDAITEKLDAMAQPDHS